MSDPRILQEPAKPRSGKAIGRIALAVKHAADAAMRISEGIEKFCQAAKATGCAIYAIAEAIEAAEDEFRGEA